MTSTTGKPSMFESTESTMWKTEGKCYDLVHSVNDYVLWESFFADSVDERRPALEFCEGCPVQQKCLKFALENKELWGVWGGRDESEIRRDLWVNSNGTIGGRARWPRCAWCKSAPEAISVTDYETHEITCSECGFQWKSDTTHMGIEENDLTLPTKKA